MGNDCDGLFISLFGCLCPLESKFCKTVLRKDTFSGSGKNRFSYCLLEFKLNNIKTLIFRSNESWLSYFSLAEEIIRQNV